MADHGNDSDDRSETVGTNASVPTDDETLDDETLDDETLDDETLDVETLTVDELRRRRTAIDHTVEALCNRLAAGDPTDEDVAVAVREADELVTRLRDAGRNG